MSIREHAKMGSKKTYQVRREAGLCVHLRRSARRRQHENALCGLCGEDAAEKPSLCKPEFQRRNYNLSPQTRENRQKYHARRYAILSRRDSVPSAVGNALLQKRPQGRVCTECRLHRKTIADRARQRKRDQEAGIPEGSDYHWPHGVLPVYLKEMGNLCAFI
jgi:hypothetical protein